LPRRAGSAQCQQRGCGDTPGNLGPNLVPQNAKTPFLGPLDKPADQPIDPELARLVTAWPNLTPTARRMILAAVEADKPAG
jgi:hypothetical protein